MLFTVFQYLFKEEKFSSRDIQVFKICKLEK